MFYYTYKIVFDDNTYYYGSRGCRRSPEFDIKYLSSSSYVKDKISDGIVFTKTIVATFNDRDQAYNAEYILIANHIMFTECINRTLPNKTTPVGKYTRIKIIHSTGKKLKVPDYKIQEYLDIGYTLFEYPSLTFIIKNNILRRVLESELPTYIEKGWTRTATKSSKGMKYMYHSTTLESVVVPITQVDVFISRGYLPGRGPNYKSAVKNTIRVVKAEVSKRIPKEQVQLFLNDGWIQIGTRRGKRVPSKWVFNVTTNHSTYVPVTEVDSYLRGGYILKNPNNKSKGKIWIHTNAERKTIEKSELKSYLDTGWNLGTGSSPVKGKIWANDGVKNYMSTQENIERSGLQLGRL